MNDKIKRLHRSQMNIWKPILNKIMSVYVFKAFLDLTSLPPAVARSHVGWQGWHMQLMILAKKNLLINDEYVHVGQNLQNYDPNWRTDNCQWGVCISQISGFHRYVLFCSNIVNCEFTEAIVGYRVYINMLWIHKQQCKRVRSSLTSTSSVGSSRFSSRVLYFRCWLT